MVTPDISGEPPVDHLLRRPTDTRLTPLAAGVFRRFPRLLNMSEMLVQPEAPLIQLWIPAAEVEMWNHRRTATRPHRRRDHTPVVDRPSQRRRHNNGGEVVVTVL